MAVALYRGDRIVFTHSGGRLLGQHEEAVILGAYDNRLWYRPETGSGEGLGEGSALAWCLSETDTEDIIIGRRCKECATGLYAVVPPACLEVSLPLLPAFQGGLLQVDFPTGAMMRVGLEIDASESLDNIPFGTVLFALGRRHNCSNIARYKVSAHAVCV
jgi:hypothetical protein